MEAMNRARAEQIVHVDPWDGHPFYPTPEGFEDETFDYVFDLTAATSQTAKDLALRVDADGDFQWRSLLGEYVVGAGLADVRFTNPSGSYMSSDFIIWDEFIQWPATNQQSPIFPEVRVPANGVLLIDVDETSGTGPITIRVLLVGVKRRKLIARKCDFPPAGGGTDG